MSDERRVTNRKKIVLWDHSADKGSYEIHDDERTDSYKVLDDAHDTLVEDYRKLEAENERLRVAAASVLEAITHSSLSGVLTAPRRFGMERLTKALERLEARVVER